MCVCVCVCACECECVSVCVCGCVCVPVLANGDVDVRVVYIDSAVYASIACGGNALRSNLISNVTPFEPVAPELYADTVAGKCAPSNTASTMPATKDATLKSPISLGTETNLFVIIS